MRVVVPLSGKNLIHPHSRENKACYPAQDADHEKDDSENVHEILRITLAIIRKHPIIVVEACLLLQFLVSQKHVSFLERRTRTPLIAIKTIRRGVFGR